MPIRVPVFAVAAVISLIAGAAAHAAPVGPGQMTLIRKAVSFRIETRTDQAPTALKLSCKQRTQYVQQCTGSWRNKRYAYKGRVIVADDGGAYDVAFAGIRTDRRCALKKKGIAKRLCRDAYYF